MSDEFDDELDRQPQVMFEVETPTGAKLDLLTEDEQARYIEMAERYQKDNKLPNASDLATLDQILFNEIMCYRWQKWVSSEKDYFGEPVTLSVIQKSIGEYSKETRELKKSLGMDKLNRDKEKGDSIADYLANLRVRAMAQGIKREEENIKALTLWMELVAKTTFYLKSNEAERKEFQAQALDILDWVITKHAEIEEIDRRFRQDGPDAQKLWIDDM